MAIGTISPDTESIGELIISEEIPRQELADRLFKAERKELGLNEVNIQLFACERLEDWPFGTINSRMGLYNCENKYGIFISPKDMYDSNPQRVNKVIRHELHHVKWVDRIFNIPLLPRWAKYAAVYVFYPVGELLAQIYQEPPQVKE